MEIISFGEYTNGKSYKVLDERQMRGSAGRSVFNIFFKKILRPAKKLAGFFILTGCRSVTGSSPALEAGA